MRAFDIHLNDKKLCVAGIGDDGVLTTIVSWVTGRGRSDLFLHVGGIVNPANEHVAWTDQKPLHVGDRIQLEIIESASVDKPKKKQRTHPAERLEAKKRYVREMAKQLGWKIQTRPKDLRPKT
jgi:hypothetical protein